MATTIISLRVDAPTAAGGTVDITYPGVGNAAAAIVFGNHAESGDIGSEVAESKHSLGFWTPSAQCVFSTYNKDGRATGSGLTGHREKTGSVFMLLNDSDTGIKTEFIGTAITDGIRLTRQTTGTDAPTINVMLIGEGAEASLQTPTISGTEGNSVSQTLPFSRPDCAITAMTSDQLDNSSTHGGTNHFSLGFLSLLPGRTEMAAFTSAEASDHASTGAENLVGVPGASWGGVSTQSTLVCSDPSRNVSDGFDWIVDLAMTGDSSFDLTTTKLGSDTSPPQLAALFLKIPDHYARVGLLTTPTSTGTAAATLSNPPEGTPSAILIAQTTCTAANTELTASGVPAGVGLGVYTATNGEELSMNRRSRANVTPSETASEQHDTLINVNRHDPSNGFTASVDSVSAGTLNISTTRAYTSAFVMPYLLLEPNGVIDNSSLLSTLEARHDTNDTALAVVGSNVDAIKVTTDSGVPLNDAALDEIADAEAEASQAKTAAQSVLAIVNDGTNGNAAIKTAVDAIDTGGGGGGPVNQVPVAPRNIVRLSSRADGTYTATTKLRLRAGESRVVAIDASRQLGGSKRLYGMGAPSSSDATVVVVGSTEYTDYGVDRELAKIKLTVPDGVAAGSTATITVEIQPTQGEVIEAEVQVEIG